MILKRYINEQAEESSVARGEKKFETNLAFVTPRLPMSVHKKCQPIRSSRLAGQREHLLFFFMQTIENFFFQPNYPLPHGRGRPGKDGAG